MIRIISLVGIVISLAIGFSLLGVPGAQAMLFAILLIALCLTGHRCLESPASQP